MVRAEFSAAVVASALLAAAQAFTLTITNNCAASIDVYQRQAYVYTDSFDTLAVGGSVTKTIEKGYSGHFRNGSSTSATLVEFSTGGDYDLAWFDISIIPPELTAGHEYCMSLDDCKANSATGVGFNTAVRLTPLANTGKDTCEQLDCLADYCEDAYNYPTDDTKTHACAIATDFSLTFCPDGTSDYAANEAVTTTDSQTTEAPATEAPATEAPATEAPATEAPATEAPATEAPATEAPATVAAGTEAPAVTDAPVVTEAPVVTTAAPVATTTDKKGKKTHCV